MVSSEYSHNAGLQADARDFRLARANSNSNLLNGGVPNPAFASAIIDVTNTNNGAFLRNGDDGQPGTLFGIGFINQSLSFTGTVFNIQAVNPYTAYTPITSGTTTTNFITFNNGLAPVGQRHAATTALGVSPTIASTNVGFFATTGQIIQGTPGVGYTGGTDLLARRRVGTDPRYPLPRQLYPVGSSAFSDRTVPGRPAGLHDSDRLLQQGNLTAAAPTIRRPNCRAAVIAAGLAADATTADAFLATFTRAGVGLSGTYAGNPGLAPERAVSWKVGGELTPRWIPGLSISADYINLDLRGTIIPTGLGQGIMSCYDSPTYPDTTAQTGNNLCNSFTRDSQFQIANGYHLSFLNLGSLRVRAINISASYPLDLGSWGKLSLRGNAYHLRRFETAASGDYSLDGLRSDGTFSRPKWEIQGSARYEKDDFYISGTWNHRSPTRIFSSSAVAGLEIVPFNLYPAIDVFDAAVGFNVNEEFRFQISASDLTDVTYAGDLGYLFQDYYDQIGRRFQITAIAKF